MMTTETAAELAQHKPPHVKITIHINGPRYEVHEVTLTGAQLCALAGIPAGNQLSLRYRATAMTGRSDRERLRRAN